MRLLVTTTSLAHWVYQTEWWFLGADFSYEYKYLYIRVAGIEVTLGWK